MRFALCGMAVLALSATALAQNQTPDRNQTRPADVIKALQEEIRLHPERAELRYQLGLAFHGIGDEAEAEVELREAVSRMPDSAAVHNILGIVLFQMGNVKAATEEFRTAVRLAPVDPNVHFNLAEALARTGDNAKAMEEIRTASALAPGDAGLARLVKGAESTLAPAASTIKVDVRQVLVPVVVTDKDGHHISGLTQADFKVFEDGVEQKISAFTVETSGMGEAAIPAAGRPAPAVQTNPASRTSLSSPAAPARRTYLICIDTLHTGFNNFVAIREALLKLFQQEHSADSQYVVIAIGTSSQIILNTTSDSNAVLAALESKKFQKIFLDGQTGGMTAELARYRRDLNETRMICDLADKTGEMPARIRCDVGKQRVPQEAQQISELDRTLTVSFLRQFRVLVAQLARARDRRTVVLVSDGFQIVPGHEAFDLLMAYFPDLQRFGLQRPERMNSEFEPILQVAAKSNVTIDTIDSRGLYGQSEFDASTAGNPVTVDGAIGRAERNAATDSGNTLTEIAEATGGTAFHDNNNLLSGFERAFADGRNYYTIGYVSSNGSMDGKFRTITVQTPGRNAVVNAKRGYRADTAAQ